ncbi:hypothetical protein HQ520_10400 [bacterium]|nr:hypothetical protein [bacterium]
MTAQYRTPSPFERNRQQGLAYVGLLILLIVISTLGLAFLARSGTEAAATLSRSNQIQAEYLTEAAAHHAMWRLLHEINFPPSEDVYYLHDFAGGRYGYKVRRHTDTTFATVATVGQIGQSTAHQSYVLFVKNENLYAGNHLLYNTDNGGEDRLPWQRQFDRPNWSIPNQTVDNGNSKVHWLEVESSSTRNEMVMGTLDEDNDIHLAVWTPEGWGQDWDFTIESNRDRKVFDIACESVTGDVLVVGRHADSTLLYTIWNGSTWTTPAAASTIFPAEKIQFIEMESNPLSDEILVAVVTDAEKLYLLRWNGHSFSTGGTLISSVQADDTYIVDIAYESISGHAMILWAEKNIYTCGYCTWDGATLSHKSIVMPFLRKVRLVQMAADPTSDFLFAVNIDDDNRVSLATWNGSYWDGQRRLLASTEFTDRHCVDVAWTASGSEALVAWGKKGSSHLEYLRWPKDSWLEYASVQTGPSFSNAISVLRLFPISDGDEMLLIVDNNDENLFYTLWTEGVFPVDPPKMIANKASNKARMPFDLAIPKTPETNP